MKSSRTVATSDVGRRAQPPRQTRTNPPRSTGSGRGGRDRDGPPGHEQPIDIFPGVTHFADAIAALPKELVKHFTLLKEVDAKIHAPQQALFQLIDSALRQPVPNTTRSPFDGRDTSASASASASGSTTALPLNTAAAIASGPANGQSGSSSVTPSVYDESNLPRRRLFRQVTLEIREMLVALEEKNHVISTANDALNKQLGRIDDIWPHLEKEFSDEAKYGSNTHWAYPENRAATRAANSAQQAERSRREGAASLSAAAQQIADEAAARSDARKQAVAARRSQKTQTQQQQDSDADDLVRDKVDGRKSAKSRKPPPETSASSTEPLSGTALANGTAAASKRKRPEKTTSASATSAAMERTPSTMSKGKLAYARQSPGPEGGKKRKALPGAGNTAKKSRNAASATSSPVIGALPDPGRNSRPSPAPSNLGVQAAETMSRNPSQASSVLGATLSLPTSLLASDKPGVSDQGSTPFDTRVPPPPFGLSGLSGPSPSGPSGPSGSAGPSPSGPSGPSGSSDAPPATAPAVHTSLSTAPMATSIPPPVIPGEVRPPATDRQPASTVTVSASGVQPGLADSHENKNESKQRPVPPALAANGSSAQPASTTHTHAHTNGTRATMGQARDLPVATPVPVPVPAMATANHVAPDGPLSKVDILKEEAIDGGSSVSLVPMTRTRSAGGLKKETSAAPGAGVSPPSATSMSMPAPAVPTGTASKASPADESAASAAPANPKREPASSSGTSGTSGTPGASGTSGASGTPGTSGLSGTSGAAVQPLAITTKSGRASKPSTPSMSTFAEAAPRTRPSRTSEPAASNGNTSSSSGSGSGSGTGNGNGTGGSAVKRSHKKGASISSQHARDAGHARDHHRSHSHSTHADEHGGSGSSGSGSSGSDMGKHQGQGQGQGQGQAQSQVQSQQRSKAQRQKQQQKQQAVEEDEPLYCYCQRVSFGEMIACDADDCVHEWFHLECAGLRVAPKSNAKWYCDDCKKRLKVKSSGR